MSLFTDHPHAVGETYGQHFRVALSYSGRMFAAGSCALVHAFLPFLFEKTASTIVRKMVAEMNNRLPPLPAEPAAAASAAKVQPAE